MPRRGEPARLGPASALVRVEVAHGGRHRDRRGGRAARRAAAVPRARPDALRHRDARALPAPAAAALERGPGDRAGDRPDQGLDGVRRTGRAGAADRARAADGPRRRARGDGGTAQLPPRQRRGHRERGRRRARDGRGAVELVAGDRRSARAQGVPQARAGDQPGARDAALPHRPPVPEHRPAARLVRVRRAGAGRHARRGPAVPARRHRRVGAGPGAHRRPIPTGSSISSAASAR